MIFRLFHPGDGSGSSEATDPNEPGSGSAAGSDSESLDYFGLGDDGEAADPSSAEDGSKPPESADPPKEPPDGKDGTTSEDGSEKDGDKGQEPKKLAGKYDTLEALEAGYGKLLAHSKGLESENKTYREQLADLTAKVQEIEKNAGADPGRTPQAPELSDEAKAARQELEQVLGDDGMNALDKFLKAVTPRTDTTELEEIRNKLAKAESRDFERELAERRPDSTDSDVQAEMQKIAKEMEDPKNAEDHYYTSGLIVDAAKGRMLDRLIDRGVASKLKTLSKEEKAKLLAGNLMLGANAGGKGGGGDKAPDPKRKEQQEAFFDDQKQLMPL
jgi:hypothetical protein